MWLLVQVRRCLFLGLCLLLSIIHCLSVVMNQANIYNCLEQPIRMAMINCFLTEMDLDIQRRMRQTIFDWRANQTS